MTSKTDKTPDKTDNTPSENVEGGVATVADDGDVVVLDPALPREAKVTVKRRLQDEGRWYGDIELVRDRMMKECRKQEGMSKEDAQSWVYSELDRLYPPLPVSADPPETPPDAPPRDDGQVQGLGAIPESWGTLPLNSSLQAELGWVQAHRLTMVEAQPGGATVVHLERAMEPAPSMAALGWLETSIRSYAKYVDVVARSLASAVDEQANVQRERMAIDEIRALLREMREATE